MKEWEKQERGIAKRRGGVQTRGSGSGWRQRNDVREGRDILWEAKQTDGKSISVSKAVWNDLRTNAILGGAMPALDLQIGDLGLVVISRDDFDTAFPIGESDG
jgi:hypothetical protein